jgi:pimeloyl-ACP methyl ester carboxylesterase
MSRTRGLASDQARHVGASILLRAETMQRRTIRTKDGELALVEAGSPDAPALVLLHGWPQTSAAFEPVLREQDANDNIESKEIAVPISTLCVRGSREPGRLEDYVHGLRDAGFARARGERIDDCGHFSPDEQPRRSQLRFAGSR